MKVEIKEKYKIVRPDEGMVLTNYKEGDNINIYTSFKECICSLECDLKYLSEITEEQDLLYKNLYKETVKEYEKQYV